MRRLPVHHPGLVTVCILLGLTVISSFTQRKQYPKNPDITVSLWAKQPMLKNPVALSHDRKGRIYVTESNRRKSVDLDVRSMRGLDPLPWPALDYSIQSVEQRREVIHKYLANDSPFNNPWMQDYNGDGEKSWHDFKAKSERINLIEDTDGDGIADKASVFAEDFNTELTGTAGGVLWHNDRVYFTVIPDLWVLRDHDQDGVADDRTSLITGHGVHIGQGGHDLHGLTLGPDGRIYWSIGDKGINITSKEGRRFLYPNQGVVMRSEPDGSNFEVFARGLRNCQEMAFDDFGNLFCVDNDGDFKGERERLVYVTRDSDTGWRINWQFNHINKWAKAQGLPEYNPWMEEALSVPHFKGQAAYITPALSNYSDGPAGFTKNPGTALSEEYNDYFFLTQFPGQKITAFQLQPKGAAFEMKNEHLFQSGFMATGLSFGPEGALYVADWAGNWEPTSKGAIFKLDVDEVKKHPLREQTQLLVQAGSQDLPDDSLVSLLGYPDQRVRLDAQFELVQRSRTALLTRIALDDESEQLARIHSLWGLGQLARKEQFDSASELLSLLDDADDQIKIQACRLIAEAPALFEEAEPSLIKLLKDKNWSIRFHAAQTLGDIGSHDAILPLVELLGSDAGLDPFVRHGAITGLAGIGEVEALASMHDDPVQNVRIGAVVALRRLAAPEVQAYLNDEDPLVALEAARAIHDDFGIPEALPALASLLNKTPHLSNEALMRRVLNANLRTGETEQAQAVLEFFKSGNGDQILQAEALSILISWHNPPAIDRVERRYRILPERDPATVKALLQSNVADLLGSDSRAGASTFKLLNHYNIDIKPTTLRNRLADDSRNVSERIEALNLLAELPKHSKPAFTRAFNSGNSALKMAALAKQAEQDEKAAVKRIRKILKKESNIQERQHAIYVLGNLKGKQARDLLAGLVEKLAENKTSQHEKLDVYMAAEANGNFEGALSAIKSNTGSENKVPYEFSLFGGNSTTGLNIFMQHPQAQCIRCHAINESGGSTVGPRLGGIGEEFSRWYLLQSLVEPGVRLAEGFENDASVSAMPPMGDILTPAELRDVVAYLKSL